jgi:hypothetical protein
MEAVARELRKGEGKERMGRKGLEWGRKGCME